MLRQRECRRRADAFGAACDQSYFSLELHDFFKF
jgi:hypothetical protein